MISSGLSQHLGHQFTSLASLPLIGTMTALAGGMSFLTEFTSNMASTEMILPILASMAKGLKIDPLLLMIPTTLAASCAFMLPAATAPNAIIFSSGKVTIKQMIKTGFWINVFSFSFYWSMVLFHISAVNKKKDLLFSREGQKNVHPNVREGIHPTYLQVPILTFQNTCHKTGS